MKLHHPGGLVRFVTLTDSEDPSNFNPDDMQKYFEGIEYPASTENVTAAAEENGA